MGGGKGREGMGGGAEPCGLQGQGQLWLLAQGGLWAEELGGVPNSGAHQHPLAAVEGIDCGDTQGEQVTALVWMDDGELD